jgi:hypothetical protein
MKPNRIFLALAFCLGLAAVAPRVEAQKAQVYTYLSGGNTIIPTLATNQFVVSGITNQFGSPTSYFPTASNMVATVAEYNDVGLTWGFVAPVGSTNATVNLKIYKSFDNGVSYESTPSFSYAITPTAINAAAGTVLGTNLDLSVPGVSHLAFSLDNNTAGYVTNVVLKLNDKSPKYGARAATQ